MDVKVTYLGIILATVASMGLGFLWYSPKLFGTKWMKAVGLKDKDMKSSSNSAMVWMVATSLLTSFVLNHIINFAEYFNRTGWVEAGLMSGFWLGVGIAAPTLITHAVFEKKARTALWINVGFSSTVLIIKGVIIGYFLDR